MAIIKITNVGEDVEKLQPSWVAGGNVKWCSHFENMWQFLKMSNIELLHDPVLGKLNE